MARRRRSESEAVLRDRAYTDFYTMGIRRSVNALYEDYKKEAAEKGPSSVPTLNRTELYRWAKEDDWDQRVAEASKDDHASERRNYDEIRKKRLDDISDLSPHAISRIHYVLTNSDDPKITPTHLLRASELVLGLLGLSQKTALTIRDESDDGFTDQPDAVVEQDLSKLYQDLVRRRETAS